MSVVIQFQILTAWRQVEAKTREPGESGDVEVAHDTAYFLGIKPLLVELLRCSPSACGKLAVPALTMYAAGAWNTVVKNGADEVRVRCTSGMCEGELVPK